MSSLRRFPTIPLVALIATALGSAVWIHAGRGSAHDPVRRDDDCLRCHESLKSILQQESPHAPASEGLCIACHSPHAAKFPKLLQQRERALCNTCHEESILKLLEGSVHTPVRRGECTGCHDPHGAPHAGLLKRAGNDLCLGCHETQKQQLGWSNPHSPFTDGECAFCHLPHNSRHPYQLNEGGAAVCTQCHEDGTEEALAAHRKISVAGKDCRSCHQPHASTSRKLLRPVVHQPFATGRCDDCHVINPTGVLALVATGARLCTKCHEGYPRPRDPVVHAPVAEGDCKACHLSHAGNEPKLLTATRTDLCLGCHEPIRERQRRAKTAHPMDGAKSTCSSCHQAHSSRDPGLLNADGIRTCLSCHQQAQHGHPMGSDRLDPRTGKGMTCLSCHDPHGTDFPYFLVGDQTRGLCVECHNTDHEPGRSKGRTGR